MACIQGKKNRALFRQAKARSTVPVDLTHSDIFGKLDLCLLKKEPILQRFWTMHRQCSLRISFKNLIFTSYQTVQGVRWKLYWGTFYALRIDGAEENSSTSLRPLAWRHEIVLDFTPGYICLSNGSSEWPIQYPRESGEFSFLNPSCTQTLRQKQHHTPPGCWIGHQPVEFWISLTTQCVI